jgi:hypothetical protein
VANNEIDATKNAGKSTTCGGAMRGALPNEATTRASLEAKGDKLLIVAFHLSTQLVA